MLKLKEISEPTSCLNRATDDEPIFILKSTDELASSIVRTWAIMYFKQKSAQPMGMTPKQRAKYEEAMALAAEMDQWHFNYAQRTGKPSEMPRNVMAYAHPMATPGDNEPLSSGEIITRLCRLQAMLFEELTTVETADCFCGKGGFWGTDGYAGTFEGGYRNDGVALKFIQDAVREKLQRMGRNVTEVTA